MQHLLLASMLMITSVVFLGIPPAKAQFGGDAFSAVTNWGDPYVYALEDKVQKFWHPPKGKKWNDLTIELTIQKNGRISQIKTVNSSGHPTIDRLAIHPETLL